MHTGEFWRDFFEGRVFAFFFYTACLGPAGLGVLLGRYAPVWLRFLPYVFLIPAGYFWIKNSDHGFELLILGTLLLIAGTVLGLSWRAQMESKPFRDYAHLDWLTLAALTLGAILNYTAPRQ